MFEDQEKPNAGPLPDDIFSGVGDASPNTPQVAPTAGEGAPFGARAGSEFPSALGAGRLKPISIPTAPHEEDEDLDEDEMEIKQPILKRGKMAIIAVIAVIVLALGLIVFFVRYRSQNKVASPAAPKQSVTQASTETAPQNKNAEDVGPVVAPALQAQPKDSDGDGLTDEEEKKLGTNANNPDTDGDGLTDKEEVLLWHTDPLKKDTDSDSYADGEEVSHGYNPLGPGKLFQ